MAKSKLSTAELVGISNFSRNGLQTYEHGEIVFFLVQPTNISVLSETNVALKIQHLVQLLTVQPDIEIICSDATSCPLQDWLKKKTTSKCSFFSART